MSDSTNILVDVDLEPSANPETLTAIRLSQKQSCDNITSDGMYIFVKIYFFVFFCHNYWFFFLPCMSNYLSRFLATFQYFKFLLTDPILFYSLFCLFFVEKILLRFLFVLFQPVHLTLIWKFVSKNIVLLILKLSCMYLLT